MAHSSKIQFETSVTISRKTNSMLENIVAYSKYMISSWFMIIQNVNSKSVAQNWDLQAWMIFWATKKNSNQINLCKMLRVQKI